MLPGWWSRDHQADHDRFLEHGWFRRKMPCPPKPIFGPFVEGLRQQGGGTSHKGHWFGSSRPHPPASSSRICGRGHSRSNHWGGCPSHSGTCARPTLTRATAASFRRLHGALPTVACCSSVPPSLQVRKRSHNARIIGHAVKHSGQGSMGLRKTPAGVLVRLVGQGRRGSAWGVGRAAGWPAVGGAVARAACGGLLPWAVRSRTGERRGGAGQSATGSTRCSMMYSRRSGVFRPR